MSRLSETSSAPRNPPESASPQWSSEMGTIVRQPILDQFGLVHGYELLFRTGAEESPEAASHHALTILDNILLFGVNRLTAGLPAFFSCNAEALTDDFIAALPPSTTVLELSARQEISPKLLAVCRRLKTAGFRFALVEFTEESEPHPLLRLVDYVKVDSSCLDTGACVSLRHRFKDSSASMVVSGIHSRDSYRKARAEGFKYCQGFYFCNPEPLKNASMSANQLVQLEILRELFKDPLDLKALCPLVLRDASLVYRVLRLVNSPLYAIRNTVNSLESAIVILGDVAFRRIATLAIQCTLNAGRPREILHMALVRARFCAQSAPLCNLDANEQYLLGMLSLLPAMLPIPMEAMVLELPLRDQVRQALLGHPTHERCLLDWIECHEANKLQECQAIENLYGLDRAKLMQSYVDALVAESTSGIDLDTPTRHPANHG